MSLPLAISAIMQNRFALGVRRIRSEKQPRQRSGVSAGCPLSHECKSNAISWGVHLPHSYHHHQDNQRHHARLHVVFFIFLH